MADPSEVSRLFEQASQHSGRLANVLHRWADIGVRNPTEAAHLRREYIAAKNAVNSALAAVLRAYPELSAGVTVNPTPQPTPQPAPPQPQPSPQPVAPTPQPQPVAPTPTPTPAPADARTRQVFGGLRLFVDPESPSAVAARRATDAYERRVFQFYARHPVGFWYGGWPGAVDGLRRAATAARQQNQVLTAVLYNAPNRDASGGYSAGGTSYAEYPIWLREGIQAVGNTPTIWIVEPDALADLAALPQDRQGQRTTLISQTVRTLKDANSRYWVYIDAGNYSWQSPATMVPRLRASEIDRADGFACNVSGFGWQDRTEAWANQLSGLLGGKHYVVDTSRNGVGPWINPAGHQWDDWCNPPGRLLGHTPRVAPTERCDAYLWIKRAGESDGNCKGGPTAGEWYPKYAIELAREAVPR